MLDTDRPVRRDGGVPGVDALEVGLVEAGEDPLRVRRLELAVQVDLAVDRVDAAVQALPARRVREVGVDDQGVLGGQAGQRQPRLGGPAATCPPAAPLSVADRMPAAATSMKVVRTGLGAAEGDLGDRPERALARVAGTVRRGPGRCRTRSPRAGGPARPPRPGSGYGLPPRSLSIHADHHASPTARVSTSGRLCPHVTPEFSTSPYVHRGGARHRAPVCRCG